MLSGIEIFNFFVSDHLKTTFITMLGSLQDKLIKFVFCCRCSIGALGKHKENTQMFLNNTSEFLEPLLKKIVAGELS